MTKTLKEQNLTFLLIKTLADVVKTETDKHRAELMEVLLAQFEDTGNKSYSVHIPGAEKVATFTIAEPKPTHKVDAEALLEWCKVNRKDLVETIEHEPVPARTEYRLRDDVEKVITGEYNLAGTMYINPDGIHVEGVEYVPAGTPKSFTVRYEKQGQDRVIQAWRGGELAGIEPGSSLPQIGGQQ